VAPFRVERNITRHDKLWIKGTPYNVKFMLADDPLADRFVGGTVYTKLTLVLQAIIAGIAQLMVK